MLKFYLPQLTCPFPSLSRNNETINKELKNDPTRVKQELLNEALLIRRIALTVTGAVLACSYVHLASHTYYYLSIPVTATLTGASLISTPCVLLGTGAYFLIQGACSLAGTKEISDLFRNISSYAPEMALGLGMVYFHDTVQIGVGETQIQYWAKTAAKKKEEKILNY